MSRFGLIGPSYTSQSVNADCQMTMDMYVEAIESGQGKSASALYPRPGIGLFCSVSKASPRGIFEFNGRCFTVASDTLYEIMPFTSQVRGGPLAVDANPVFFSANNANQVAILSANQLYIYNLTTNLLTEVTSMLAQPSPNALGFLDGFFVVTFSNTQEFQISALEDGTSWDGADVAQVNYFAENIVGMIIDHREICFFGSKHSVFYNDSSGNPLFPFGPIPGAFMEEGSAAAFGAVSMDNSFFWIGRDERGQGIAWRANGYNPVRVSNHAIEYAWSQYPTISDAWAFSYQDQGHTFWVINFPSVPASGLYGVGRTWVYDAATGTWCQRGFWNESTGRYDKYLPCCHAFAFNKHLVGLTSIGPANSVIAEMNINFYSDLNQQFPGTGVAPIRRMRRSPHLSVERERVNYQQLEIYLESGLGPQPPLTGGTAQGIRNFVLVDTNGQQWLVSMLDNGSLQQVPTSGATVTPLYLWSTVPSNTYWQIGIGTDGRLFQTEVSAQASAVQNLAMITASGFQGGLSISGQGVLQANQPTPVARDPQMMLKTSKDGGHTWSNQLLLNCGQAGNFLKRVFTWRLGQARDMVFEIATTDAIPWRIVDGYIKASPGFQPQERLTDQFRKEA